MMCHLRERIEQMAEPGIISCAGDRPDEDYSLAEKILTRATGALALLVVSPLIALVRAGLKLERPGPAIAMRMTRGEVLKLTSSRLVRVGLVGLFGVPT